MIARGIRRFSIGRLGGGGDGDGGSSIEGGMLETGTSITTIIIDGEAARSFAHATGLVATRRDLIDGIALIAGVPSIGGIATSRVHNEVEVFNRSDKATGMADPFVGESHDRLL
jgi:hypothetical protein